MTLTAIILAAAKSAGVPGALLLAICTSESKLINVMVPHDGGTPSYGICQIKRGSAIGYEGISTGPMQPSKIIKGTLEPKGKPQGLMIPYVNAMYAAKYLQYQLNRYNGNPCMAVAASNAGSYLPSSRTPGKPKNYTYVKGVTLLLDDKYKDFLVCGPRKVEE
jgi:hypothetical protein